VFGVTTLKWVPQICDAEQRTPNEKRYFH